MEEPIKHSHVMQEAEAMNEQHGIEQKGGKKYLEVKHRVTLFRKYYGMEYGIVTILLEANDKFVRMQARIVNAEGKVIGSGTAEEHRNEGYVNRTSAVENCESSAVGRALASLGLHGSEYASSNEMEAVVRKTKNLEEQEKKEPDPEPAPGANWMDVNKEDPTAFEPKMFFDTYVKMEIQELESLDSTGDLDMWAVNNKKHLDELENTGEIKNKEGVVVGTGSGMLQALREVYENQYNKILQQQK